MPVLAELVLLNIEIESENLKDLPGARPIFAAMMLPVRVRSRASCKPGHMGVMRLRDQVFDNNADDSKKTTVAAGSKTCSKSS